MQTREGRVPTRSLLQMTFMDDLYRSSISKQVLISVKQEIIQITKALLQYKTVKQHIFIL